MINLGKSVISAIWDDTYDIVRKSCFNSYRDFSVNDADIWKTYWLVDNCVWSVIKHLGNLGKN